MLGALEMAEHPQCQRRIISPETALDLGLAGSGELRVMWLRASYL